MISKGYIYIRNLGFFIFVIMFHRNFAYQPRAKSRARIAAFLSASLFEFGVYQTVTNVIPITPF